MSRATQTDLTMFICMQKSKEKHMVVLMATVINMLLDMPDLVKLKCGAEFDTIVTVSTEVFLYLTLENNWDNWLYNFISDSTMMIMMQCNFYYDD